MWRGAGRDEDVLCSSVRGMSRVCLQATIDHFTSWNDPYTLHPTLTSFLTTLRLRSNPCTQGYPYSVASSNFSLIFRTEFYKKNFKKKGNRVRLQTKAWGSGD